MLLLRHTFPSWRKRTTDIPRYQETRRKKRKEILQHGVVAVPPYKASLQVIERCVLVVLKQETRPLNHYYTHTYTYTKLVTTIFLKATNAERTRLDILR